MIKILAILDDRPGNNTQVEGIANRLSKEIRKSEVIKKRAIYNAFAKLPFLKFINHAYHLSNPKEFDVKADIVITAGRRAAFVGYLHKKNFGSKWIHNMWPGFIAKHADILVLPFHDKTRKLPNIIRFLGAPNNLDISKLEEEAKDFIEFSSIDKPKLACLIGGSHKSGKFTNEMAEDLADKINSFVYKNNVYPLVTLSRRTGEAQANTLKEKIADPKYLYDLKGLNPYKAMLYYADSILVTSDSISMISEAVATQKQVYIYDHEDLSGNKHKEFIKELINQKVVSY
ncbi:MAG: mitochondrial fission ELM1 family protein, partial [Alphaproteobacteria bacterium]|nr:mitochondrial fission ELM1 family protein [Alphaproteobacteria bacterium]